MSPRREEPNPPTTSEGFLPEVAEFDGVNSSCGRFLFQANLAIRVAPSRFPTDSAKSAFMLTLLKGAAQEWAYALLEEDVTFLEDFERFTQALKRNFEVKGKVKLAHRQRSILQQGTGSVEEYVRKFNQLASEINWCCWVILPTSC
jgi:retrotransposon gag protein